MNLKKICARFIFLLIEILTCDTVFLDANVLQCKTKYNFLVKPLCYLYSTRI